MDRKKRAVNKGTVRILVICAILVLIAVVGSVVPLPYYVYVPGTADPLAPMVRVDGGTKNERGSLLLLTVYEVQAQNVWEFLWAVMQPESKVMPEKQVTGPFSPSEYLRLENFMMMGAKDAAEYEAFKYAGKAVQVKENGVLIAGVAPTSKAKGKLLAGDVIEKVGDNPIHNTADLARSLQGAKAGVIVRIEVKRGSASKTVNVPLVELPASGGLPSRTGIGIDIVPLTTIVTPQAVHIKTGDIGGPSGGMMFTLELINQITGEDLTRGYKIAGTGTIDQTGAIGPIGGVQQKVVAASRAGASYFLVPTAGGNAKDAMAEAKKIHTSMKVVPVTKLSDAINFLKSLPKR